MGHHGNTTHQSRAPCFSSSSSRQGPGLDVLKLHAFFNFCRLVLHDSGTLPCIRAIRVLGTLSMSWFGISGTLLSQRLSYSTFTVSTESRTRGSEDVFHPEGREVVRCNGTPMSHCFSNNPEFRQPRPNAICRIIFRCLLHILHKLAAWVPVFLGPTAAQSSKAPYYSMSISEPLLEVGIPTSRGIACNAL
ncbi:hypothetical protein P152DRAFT_208365 [Eremomyces bilateralis CBS 781.70]|uniref:Uncharacterized protein n=1 Tax=Eremomyces bilateralis CBS 781.70 TaxID=1392243 RepID=A0A6G1FSD1_9PEZI|nr:uncharacterized protein P152DRAFT_208365 [Eremomyces bilateralis CBS 781.70]KAF1808765.1 hypothetical protein P152DRAFT_208365 [Eremomyces bilateralis CBS 781.70]